MSLELKVEEVPSLNKKLIMEDRYIYICGLLLEKPRIVYGTKFSYLQVT